MENTLSGSPQTQGAERPHIIELPRIYDPRGNLSFVQNGDAFLPFKIERVYWTYDVPAGEERGGHSHKRLHQLLLAVNGSFNVNIFDGRKWEQWHMNRPNKGLYIPPGYWRTLDNFSSGSVCLVLASLPYDEEEYIRDFDVYNKSICDTRS